MALPAYPIPEIHKMFMQTFLENDLGLKLRSVKVIEKNLSSVIKEESWEFNFSSSNSKVLLSFGVFYPSYRICTLMFYNEEKFFSLESYLKFVNSKDLNEYAEFLRSLKGHEKQIWGLANYLAVIEKHLKMGLSKVVSGQEWIDVPFDWERVGR